MTLNWKTPSSINAVTLFQLTDVDTSSNSSITRRLVYDSNIGKWTPLTKYEYWIPSSDWFFVDAGNNMTFMTMSTFYMSTLWPAASTDNVGFTFCFPESSSLNTGFTLTFYGISGANNVTLNVTGGYMTTTQTLDNSLSGSTSFSPSSVVQMMDVVIPGNITIGNEGDVVYVNVAKNNVDFIVLGVNVVFII